MQRSEATLDECGNLGIACDGDIIIQSEERKNIPVENVRRWIDGVLFEKNASFTNRCADTTIQDIQLIGANGTTRHREESLLVSEPIGAHKHRNAIALRQGGQR